MSNVKALILGLLLLVPILVFIFIGTFGEHHFSLKTYFPKVDGADNVIFDANGDTIFHEVPAFELTSQQGKTVSRQDLEGGVYVVNFFFVTCPSICPRMTSQLTRVQEKFRDNPAVKLVSFTVNPEHDSVAVLQEYASQYNADPEKWFFLTGRRDDIYTLAEKGFYLPVQKVEGQEDFIHSEKFMLVDRKHRVRGIYNGLDAEDVDRLILEINVLLDEYSKSK